MHSTVFRSKSSSPRSIHTRYDPESNRLTRTNTTTGAVTEYGWDYRNRLTTVTERATSNGPATKITAHTYDHQNRWLTRTHHPDGDTGSEPVEQTAFVYDGVQIVHHFNKTGPGDFVASNLQHRYLWGPTVDQILTDEHLTFLETAGTVLWPLCDHLNTVRDLTAYGSQSDTATVSTHRVYNAFGEMPSETNSNATCLFTFTARPADNDTGLQNNLNRWYDPTTGQWLTEDPISYSAGDFNLRRYVHNVPLTRIDPVGYGDQCDKCKNGGNNGSGSDAVSKKVKEVFGTITSLVEFVDTVLNNADLFSKPGAIGALTDLMGNPGSTMADGLELFAKPNTPCNRWLKNAVGALPKACKGDDSGCLSIAAQPVANAGNGDGDLCVQALSMLPGGGIALATLFSNRAMAWSQKCFDAAAAKQKKAK